jgi:hypothetical protein
MISGKNSQKYANNIPVQAIEKKKEISWIRFQINTSEHWKVNENMTQLQTVSFWEKFQFLQ